MYRPWAGCRATSTLLSRVFQRPMRSSGAASMDESRSSFGGGLRLRCEHATTRATLGGRLRTGLTSVDRPSRLRLVSPRDGGVCVVAMNAFFIHDADTAFANSAIAHEGGRDGACDVFDECRIFICLH